MSFTSLFLSFPTILSTAYSFGHTSSPPQSCRHTVRTKTPPPPQTRLLPQRYPTNASLALCTAPANYTRTSEPNEWLTEAQTAKPTPPRLPHPFSLLSLSYSLCWEIKFNSRHGLYKHRRCLYKSRRELYKPRRDFEYSCP